MVSIAALSEQTVGEHRVAITPSTVTRFAKLGMRVVVETGAGQKAGFTDDNYLASGAVIAGRGEAIKQADVLLSIRPPEAADLAGLRKDARIIGGLEPYSDPARLEAYAVCGLETMALELLPRTTRAQAMDILSSQANLAGYHAVVRAAAQINRCLPMMTTAAGSIPAAKVFVIGVGVAGLQAIATARRLGALVSATDVRPETREQILSLGARPVFEEIGEGDVVTAAAGGYAGEMSEAYRRRQASLVGTHMAGQDIVITTALIPGRAAPRLVSEVQISSMKPGSVIVDLAAESGGNVEGSQAGRATERHGVVIIGLANGASHVAADASNLFARNCYNFVEHYWDKNAAALAFTDDELTSAVRLTRSGSVVHPRFAQAQPALRATQGNGT